MLCQLLSIAYHKHAGRQTRGAQNKNKNVLIQKEDCLPYQLPLLPQILFFFRGGPLLVLIEKVYGPDPYILFC
jgi:hypothetical protein